MLKLLKQNHNYMPVTFKLLMIVYLLTLTIPTIYVTSQTPPAGIFAVAWSPDGTQFVGGGSDGLLRIWDAETGAVVQDFQGIEWATMSVAWSPDGTRIASGGGDQIIRIWDVDGSLIAIMDAHDANIRSIAWNPDGSLLASASHSGLDQFSLRIWDGNTYELLVEHRTGDITSIDWNPNLVQSELAVTYESRNFRLDTVTPTTLQPGLVFENTVAMVSVAWNSDGSRLATGDRAGKIDIWNTKLDNISTFIGHIDDVDALVWSPDDTQLASASSDGTIRIWDVVTGQTIDTFENPMQIRTNSIDWNSTGLIFGTANATVEIIQFPLANAGIDQSIMDADNNNIETVSLDASLSSDSDGTIVSYEWSENGVSIATGVNPQVNLGVGVHQIVLTVTDDDGATGADVVVVTVEANT